MVATVHIICECRWLQQNSHNNVCSYVCVSVCGTLCGRMAATAATAAAKRRLIINVVWLLIVAVTPIAPIYVWTLLLLLLLVHFISKWCERCRAVGDWLVTMQYVWVSVNVRIFDKVKLIELNIFSVNKLNECIAQIDEAKNPVSHIGCPHSNIHNKVSIECIWWWHYTRSHLYSLPIWLEQFLLNCIRMPLFGLARACFFSSVFHYGCFIGRI